MFFFFDECTFLEVFLFIVAQNKMVNIEIKASYKNNYLPRKDRGVDILMITIQKYRDFRTLHTELSGVEILKNVLKLATFLR